MTTCGDSARVVASRAAEETRLHPAQLSIDDLLADCEVKRSRRSGPGGQHRNKVETAVIVTHLPTSLRGEASERRSQELNRRQAIARLRLKLALEFRHAALSQPTERWTARISDRRVSVNAGHDDFPALVSEVLDWLAANEFSIVAAASWFGVTASQLVKFLKVEPKALAYVNRRRGANGESPLH
ncbi:MAG: peptide chain release factor-like protein [Planctomycetota bacterium]